MKHFSPHLKNSGTMAAHAKPQAKPEPKGPTGVKSKPADSAINPEAQGQDKPHQHLSETHGTMPHPKTGVHGVVAMHMGGGHHVTHTHHEGGSVAVDHHDSEESVHNHMAESLPNSDDSEHEIPNGEDYMANMPSALGGDDDGDEA